MLTAQQQSSQLAPVVVVRLEGPHPLSHCQAASGEPVEVFQVAIQAS